MSEIHYGWANLPSPTHGFEIAYDEDGVAYVYGQGDDAQARAQRIISALQGTSELTALRQQVADLRAALARLLLYVEDEERFKAKFGGPEFEGSAVSEEYWLQHTVKDSAIAVLAATQPQEVQP